MKKLSLTIWLWSICAAAYAVTDVNETSALLFKAQRGVAEQGGAQAQFYLGEMYEQGLGTERDMNQAIIWYTRAANQGYVPAQRKLKDLANTDKAKPPTRPRVESLDREIEAERQAKRAEDAARRAKQQAEAEAEARKTAETRMEARRAQEIITQEAAKQAKQQADDAARRAKQQAEAEAQYKTKLEHDTAEKEKRRAAAKAALERSKEAANKGRAY